MNSTTEQVSFQTYALMVATFRAVGLSLTEAVEMTREVIARVEQGEERVDDQPF